MPLSDKAKAAIEKWAKEEAKNSAAGEALINAASRSPYLASQFNMINI